MVRLRWCQVSPEQGNNMIVHHSNLVFRASVLKLCLKVEQSLGLLSEV